MLTELELVSGGLTCNLAKDLRAVPLCERCHNLKDNA